jgi:hypothetical protein
MTKRLLKTGGVLFLFTMTLWAADDPIVGTWKLNLLKSNQAAMASFRTITAKVEPRPEGLKVTEDLVTPQGMAIHSEFTAKYDGMDYPVVGDPYFDTISITRTDPKHANATWKKAGRVLATAQNVISPDGRTWTETITTRDGQGKDVTIVARHDRRCVR